MIHTKNKIEERRNLKEIIKDSQPCNNSNTASAAIGVNSTTAIKTQTSTNTAAISGGAVKTKSEII